jgi:hypothetical protein
LADGRRKQKKIKENKRKQKKIKENQFSMGGEGFSMG